MIEAKLYFDGDTLLVANTSTGEMTPISKFLAAPKRVAKPKVVVEEANEALLTVEDNKYTLNALARKLLGVEADAKIAIKYKKVNKVLTPIIGPEEAWGTHDGNRLTKSGTVSCKGKGHDELVKYGDVFKFSENPEIPGTFLLLGNKEVPESPVIQDDNIEVPDRDLIDDINALGGVAPAADAVEISNDDFDALLNSI